MTFLNQTRTARRLRSVALAVTGLALVAACGGSSAGRPGISSGAGASAHNAADVTFATDMIPHHAQAVEMADMALATTVDPEITKLAQAIKGAQDPEISTMSGWLRDWKAPVPSTRMGHAMHGGTGMMSEDEMAALGRATGVAFDRLWVDMMTRHHRGAIEMATTEVRDGRFGPAKGLAQQIVSAQTGEVATMTTIAARLG